MARKKNRRRNRPEIPGHAMVEGSARAAAAEPAGTFSGTDDGGPGNQVFFNDRGAELDRAMRRESGFRTAGSGRRVMVDPATGEDLPEDKQPAMSPEVAAGRVRGAAAGPGRPVDVPEAVDGGRPGVGEAFASHPDTQASSRVPRDVVEAAMTGNDPARLAAWAGSTQGRRAGGVASLMEEYDPQAKARREAMDMRREEQELDRAKERKQLEGFLGAMDPERYTKDRLADASVPQLMEEKSRVTAGMAAAEREREQQEAAQKQQQQQKVRATLDDLSVLSRAMAEGRNPAEVELPGDRNPERLAGLVDHPGVEQALDTRRSGVEVTPEMMADFMGKGKEAESEPDFFEDPKTKRRFMARGNTVMPSGAGDTEEDVEITTEPLEEGGYVIKKGGKPWKHVREDSRIDPTTLMIAIQETGSLEKALEMLNRGGADPEPEPDKVKEDVLGRQGL